MTVAELIGRQTAVLSAALHWRDARASYRNAFTSSAYTGSEVAAARLRYQGAKRELLDALERIVDTQAPTSTTSGAARRVTQLEGEIVLEAISWFHAFEADERNDIAVDGLQLVDRTRDLADSVRELVQTVGELGVPA